MTPSTLTQFLAAALLSLSFSSHAQILSGKGRVVDGDSLVVRGIEVRLHGLDAPELGQTCSGTDGAWPCGDAARDALTDLIGDQPVLCQRVLVHVSYIGQCRVGKTRINQWIVENGWAVVDRRGSRRYVGFESRARRDALNIWGGPFERPWIWRENAANDNASAVYFHNVDSATLEN